MVDGTGEEETGDLSEFVGFGGTFLVLNHEPVRNELPYIGVPSCCGLYSL